MGKYEHLVLATILLIGGIVVSIEWAFGYFEDYEMAQPIAIAVIIFSLITGIVQAHEFIRQLRKKEIK